MQSTPSLSLRPDPLPGVVAPDRVLSLGQIETVFIFKLSAKRMT